MAIVTGNLRSHFPFRSGRMNEFLLCFDFETNSTSAPDGLSPAIDGITLGRTGVGDLTVTFAEDKKPYAVHACIPSIVEEQAGYHVKYTGYTLSTGVLTMTVYDEDDTSGIQAPADTTDFTIQVVLVATRSDKS